VRQLVLSEGDGHPHLRDIVREGERLGHHPGDLIELTVELQRAIQNIRIAGKLTAPVAFAKNDRAGTLRTLFVGSERSSE